MTIPADQTCHAVMRMAACVGCDRDKRTCRLYTPSELVKRHKFEADEPLGGVRASLDKWVSK